MHKAIKWLIYTVIVGLIPVLCRLLVWCVSEEGYISPFSTGDVAMFGLVVQISIINELEVFEDSPFKTVNNGVSVVCIVAYALLFTLSMFIGLPSEVGRLNSDLILTAVFVLSGVSLLLGIVVVYRACVLSIVRRV